MTPSQLPTTRPHPVRTPPPPPHTHWRHRKAAKAATKLAAGECGDENEQCTEWAFFGECEKNPAFMHASCQKACGLCPGSKKVPVQA